jgi:chorismate mutase
MGCCHETPVTDPTSAVMMVRGIRGATTVTENSRDAILEAASELLGEVVRLNAIEHDHVASIVFTATQDLNAEFPAVAARQLGWTDIALECMPEMNVPGSLQRCLRILMHVNTTRPPRELVHVYLRGARALRPDLVAHHEAGDAANSGGD